MRRKKTGRRTTGRKRKSVSRRRGTSRKGRSKKRSTKKKSKRSKSKGRSGAKKSGTKRKTASRKKASSKKKATSVGTNGKLSWLKKEPEFKFKEQQLFPKVQAALKQATEDGIWSSLIELVKNDFCAASADCSELGKPGTNGSERRLAGVLRMFAAWVPDSSARTKEESQWSDCMKKTGAEAVALCRRAELFPLWKQNRGIVAPSEYVENSSDKSLPQILFDSFFDQKLGSFSKIFMEEVTKYFKGGKSSGTGGGGGGGGLGGLVNPRTFYNGLSEPYFGKLKLFVDGFMNLPIFADKPEKFVQRTMAAYAGMYKEDGFRKGDQEYCVDMIWNAMNYVCKDGLNLHQAIAGPIWKKVVKDDPVYSGLGAWEQWWVDKAPAVIPNYVAMFTEKFYEAVVKRCRGAATVIKKQAADAGVGTTEQAVTEEEISTQVGESAKIFDNLSQDYDGAEKDELKKAADMAKKFAEGKKS